MSTLQQIIPALIPGAALFNNIRGVISTGAAAAGDVLSSLPPPPVIVPKYTPSYKVRLVPDSGSASYVPETGKGKSSSLNGITFDVQPEFQEQKNVSYSEISEILRPGSLFVFIGSPSRTFTIAAKFVSRTPSEAAINFKKLHLMKSWEQPSTADGGAGNTKSVLDQDNTPPTLRLYGYGNNLKGIPTIVTSFSYDFPIDCDYISTDDDKGNGPGASMPIIFSCNLSLREVRTQEELSTFNIDQYAQGLLPTW